LGFDHRSVLAGFTYLQEAVLKMTTSLADEIMSEKTTPSASDAKHMITPCATTVTLPRNLILGEDIWQPNWSTSSSSESFP
jgi:aspartokinase-like uncharacterized kinase